MGELGVLLLFGRQGHTADSGEFATAPSLISQDVDDGHPETSWDVTTFTHYDKSSSFNETYRVQVKAYEQPVANKGIAVVSVMRDLKLDTEAGIYTDQILWECLEEYNGSAEASDVLDLRTDKLVSKAESALKVV
jgi:hypothetical protein